MEDQTRNLNPTPEARVAMIIWGKEYSEQRGGSMDFWDSLTAQQRRRCELVVHDIAKAGAAAERERLAKLAEAGQGPQDCCEEGEDWADWLRSQGENNDQG